jgi:hypothetical protein
MKPPLMPHAQLTQFVRRLVASALPRHCRPEEAAIEESIMIRQGVYCGRRFQTAGGYAIWFVEENQVKVFEDGGRLLEVLQVTPDETTIPVHRLAA